MTETDSFDADSSRQPLRYDPGEHRVKHCWKQPEAAFVRDGSAEIGKCPSTLSKQFAEQLLNDGIGYPVGDERPERIYNLHDGVVYEAVCSGSSWHGYPWRYRPGRKSLPRQIQQELERRAEQQDCLPGYKHWMKKYGR